MSGIEKGKGCEGTDGGMDGNDDGRGTVFRGASRRGSTDFR